MRQRDYYETLGVPRDAAQETIKGAYRKLARKYHPDVSREPYAEVRFKEVGEAYKVLKDPDARLAYDQTFLFAPRRSRPEPAAKQPPQRSYGFEYREPPPPPRREEENFSSILDEMMGRPAASPPLHRGINVHGSDQHAKVQIDLEEAYAGTSRSISMPTYITDEYGAPIVTKRTLKVSIPRGIRSGQTLRLAGQGFPGMGEGRSGDLYLEVVIRPHRRYRVEGRDLFFEIPLSSAMAALGTTVNMPTPAGAVQLSIPPGSGAGRKLRLRGKGIPGDPAGDLYAVIVDAAPVVRHAVAQKAYRAFKAAFDF